MKRLVLAAVAGATVLAALPASAELERTLSLEKEARADDGTIALAWDGATASGLNTSWFLDSEVGGGSCGDTDERSFCDSTLVQVDPELFVDPKKRPTLTFRIEGFRQVDDFDLRVYRSNADGEAREYLGSPDSDVQKTSPLPIDPRATSVGDFESKVVTGVRPGDFYLVEVVYFAAAQATYDGLATLKGVPVQPAPEPTPTPSPSTSPAP